MNLSDFPTHDDLLAQANENPEFRVASRKLEPYYTVAQEVYERRAALGLTQTQLAKRSQTHQSRVSKIEAGDLDFRLSTLIELAEALHARVDIRLVPIDETIQAADTVEEIIGQASVQAAPNLTYTKFIPTMPSYRVLPHE